MITQSTLNYYYNTVWCIVASPFVAEYMVGYTRRPAKMRLSEYWKIHGYEHLVVLANGLSLEDAAKMERQLQLWIWDSPKRGVVYRKYNAQRRGGRHFPSVGPTSNIVESSGHTVYLAWLEPERD